MRPLLSFSNAKTGKYTAKQFLSINLARDPAKAVSCAAVVFSRQLGRHREIMAKRVLQRGNGILQGRPVALPRDQAGPFVPVRRHHKITKTSHHRLQTSAFRKGDGECTDFGSCGHSRFLHQVTFVQDHAMGWSGNAAQALQRLGPAGITSVKYD